MTEEIREGVNLMLTREEIKIIGDGHIVWCAWCKMVKGMPEDCDYCFKAMTLPTVEINPSVAKCGAVYAIEPLTWIYNR